MHFTYVDSPDKNQLFQGDVLKRTSALEALLGEVHPHYLNSDYSYFLVLTQSCDLVRREGELNTRYISICAVRPLELALSRELSRHFKYPFEKKMRCLEEAKKAKFQQFVERLFNNNEPSYFFLNAEPESGLSENYCAFLRLSIALRAEQHYQTLLDSKILQLEMSFQHKLGYLVGTMYSRVATEDWVPGTLSLVDFERKINTEVEQNRRILWLQRDIHKAVRGKLVDTPESSLTNEIIQGAIEDAKKEKAQKRESLFVAIEEVLADLKLDPDRVAKVRNRLQNKPAFNAILK
jgi:hypothetical protein